MNYFQHLSDYDYFDIIMDLFQNNYHLKKANYSSKKDSKSTQNSEYSVETTLDIYVHARQDAMPAGMAKILDILNNSIDYVNQASMEKGQQRIVK